MDALTKAVSEIANEQNKKNFVLMLLSSNDAILEGVESVSIAFLNEDIEGLLALALQLSKEVPIEPKRDNFLERAYMLSILLETLVIAGTMDDVKGFLDALTADGSPFTYPRLRAKLVDV